MSMSKRICTNCAYGEISSNGIVCKVDFSSKPRANLSFDSLKRCIFHRYKYNKGDMCRFCGREEVYGDLADGLCLNCYDKLQDDIAEMEREARLDYLDDLM